MRHDSGIDGEKGNPTQEKGFNKYISNSSDRNIKSIKFNTYAFCVQYMQGTKLGIF